MATVREVAELIEKLFPPACVCMEDFIGLSVGSLSARTDKAIVCLDCTEAVVDEAVTKGAGLIVSHHPLIFGSVSTVTDESPVGKIILKCAAHGINVFSAHTNMDCADGGINEYVADLLGIKDSEILIKNANDMGGVGRVGNITPTTLGAFADTVREKFSDKYVKPYGKAKNQVITKVAIVNGSGGDAEFIDEAIRVGAQCLITAEIKHHIALYAAARGLCLIETGHYASERVYIGRLTEKLNAAAENKTEIQFTASDAERDPAL